MFRVWVRFLIYCTRYTAKDDSCERTETQIYALTVCLVNVCEGSLTGASVTIITEVAWEENTSQES